MSESTPLITNPRNTHDDTDKDKRPVSRLDWAEASCFRWWYVFSFGWIIRVLSLGYKRTLTDKDLDELSYEDQSKTIFDSMIMNADWTKTSVREVIFRKVWKEFALGGVLLIPYMVTRMAQPLIIRQIFLLLEQPVVSFERAYLYVLFLFVCSILPLFLFQQAVFRVTRVGLRVRNALMILIYTRLLSTNATVFQQGQSAEVIHPVAIDAAKFADSTMYLHYLWETPLEAITAFIILYSIIGFLPTLSGFFILFSLIPLQLIFSRKLDRVYQSVSKCTEKRLQALRELLNGCYIIKLYNWEEPMVKQVHSMREEEAKGFRMTSGIRAFNKSLFINLLPILTLFTVGSSWLLNRPLNPIDIFTSVTIFGVIRAPVTSFLPTAIEKFSQLRVSMNCIETFINKLPIRTNEPSNVFSQNDHQSKGGVIMRDASFSWKNDQVILHSLNITIEPGSLVSIVGNIGSGKSSLFAALLGEMHLLGDSYVNLCGSLISHVSQSAWTFPDTIRANILLGRPFDAQRYTDVLRACSLDTDLSTFQPTGDLTIISEKGMNLSGGQKARISLARALYMDADIYLFDDPLASVDRRVAREIYDRCIGRQGLINNKTRLLVTHQTKYTVESDQIIYLVDGRVQPEVPSSVFQVDHGAQKFAEDDLNELLQIDKSTADAQPIIEDETAIIGSVSWKVWRYLFNHSITHCYKISLLMILFILAQILADSSNVLLSFVSKQMSNPVSHMRTSFLLYIYTGATVGTLVVAVIRSYCFFIVFMKGANRLHNNMVDAVAHTSMRFHESNPHGRILNRASRDQHVVDELLPGTLFDGIQALLLMAGSFFVMIFANPWLVLLVIPYLIVGSILRYIYGHSNYQLKRLESITRSPIYTIFTSTLDGLITIRASKAESYFLHLLFDRIDANTRAFFTMASASHWFGLCLDLTTNVFCVATIVLTVSLRNLLDPSLLVLLLMYSLTIKGYFHWGLRQAIEAQILMTSVERIHEYTQLPPEEDFAGHKDDLIDTPVGWPQQGSVEFRDYELRYRTGLEPALRTINLRIGPNEKIGIIGRTGAGKSSLFQGLVRLVDRSNIKGQILIDNIDIHRITLQRLRSQLSIIPQQPVLFSGTLRYNLDPCLQYTDEECWTALEVVQLKKMAVDHPAGLMLLVDGGGTNLSCGQRQLVCAARAMLKKTKVLLIDEATASVDGETETAVQEMLLGRIRDRTVLTIAHRLNTVIRSDRIVVVEMGRIVKFDSPSTVLFEYQ